MSGRGGGGYVKNDYYHFCIFRKKRNRLFLYLIVGLGQKLFFYFSISENSKTSFFMRLLGSQNV